MTEKTVNEAKRDQKIHIHDELSRSIDRIKQTYDPRLVDEVLEEFPEAE